jgi:hypothetical protein
VGFRGEGEFHFKWDWDVKRIARVEMKVGIQRTVTLSFKSEHLGEGLVVRIWRCVRIRGSGGPF